MVTDTLPLHNTPGIAYQSPFDKNAESALLGALIFDNTQLNEIVEVLKPDHFYQNSHKTIYSVMLELFDRRQAFDVVILKDQLLKHGSLNEVGGPENLSIILEAVPNASNALYYAEIIREKYILRKIISICSEILQKSARGDIDSDILLEEAQKNIFQIALERDKSDVINIKEIVKDVFKQIRDKGRQVTGLPFGLAKIDEVTGGLHPSQLIVIAGRPGSGKSSFALRLLEEVAIKENKPVVLFTLEVTGEQIVKNLLCSTARINSSKLRSGFLTDEEKRSLLEWCGTLDKAPIFIDDTSGLSVFELRNRARRLKSQFDLQLILVDYLQLMRWENAENREREIAYISSSLKSLAKELGIPVVAMAQLNRETERRPMSAKHPRPKISDLRESGAIEQDADVILLLYRDEMYNPDDARVKNLCEIIIGKQRNGPAGEKRLVLFQKENYRFENYTGSDDMDMIQDEN